MNLPQISDFEKITPYRWILRKGKDKSMLADAEIFATEGILQAAIMDQAILQVINVAALPGIVGHSFAMPDIHYGYGFCIGGVAAFPAEDGIVLPGGVGYDINCGVRLLSTGITLSEAQPQLENLGIAILRDIPTGLSTKGSLNLGKKEFMRVLKNGAREIVDNYRGRREDLECIESLGSLEFDSPEIISDRAFQRGKSQVGSLGSGNHFIEIQLVEDIYDEEIARNFQLEKGHLCVMIHTGSRGFGHQIASDYIEILRKRNLPKIKVRDPQLVYAQIHSPEGKNYLQALNAASNFAWANRHVLMEDIITIFEQIFHASREKLGLNLIYDQAHNIAKFETHQVEGKSQQLLVHRKGATRAFPAGHPELPAKYRATGQPVIIPGSMGTASYLLVGTREGMDMTFGSSAHGAGRRLSRHQAIKAASGYSVQKRMQDNHILAFSHSQAGLKEEIPEAYKPIGEVIEVTEKAGISRKIARMIPLVVIKG